MGTRPSSSANEEVRLCTDDDQAREPDRLIVVRHVRYGETQQAQQHVHQLSERRFLETRLNKFWIKTHRSSYNMYRMNQLILRLDMY